MQKLTRTQVDQEILAAAQESTTDRIWCEVCKTDEFIFVERAKWHRRHGEGVWDIDYTCSNCNRFYGHVVADADVTPALMAAMAVAKDGSTGAWPRRA